MMINTMKSVNYSLKKEKAVTITLILMAILPYLMMMFLCSVSGTDLQSLTSSYYFASQNMAMITVFFYFGIVIISCKAMGGDSVDKTINYEILSGHRRGTVFSARAVVGVFWGTILPLLFVAVPICVFGLVNGWGMETDQRNVIIRIVLCFFPLLRLCALNMMYVSVTGSAGKGIALGFVSDLAITMIQSVSEEVFHKTIYYGLGFNNVMYLLTSPNSRELVIDGKPVTVFETAVSVEMMIKTVGISLLFTVVYLAAAYMIFKKKDRS